MFASEEALADILRLVFDGEGDDYGGDVVSCEQIGEGFAGAGVVGVEVDGGVGFEGLGGFERAGVDCAESEVLGGFDGGLVVVSSPQKVLRRIRGWYTLCSSRAKMPDGVSVSCVLTWRRCGLLLTSAKDGDADGHLIVYKFYCFLASLL